MKIKTKIFHDTLNYTVRAIFDFNPSKDTYSLFTAFPNCYIYPETPVNKSRLEKAFGPSSCSYNIQPKKNPA